MSSHEYCLGFQRWEDHSAQDSQSWPRPRCSQPAWPHAGVAASRPRRPTRLDDGRGVDDHDGVVDADNARQDRLQRHERVRDRHRHAVRLQAGRRPTRSPSSPACPGRASSSAATATRRRSRRVTSTTSPRRCSRRSACSKLVVRNENFDAITAGTVHEVRRRVVADLDHVRSGQGRQVLDPLLPVEPGHPRQQGRTVDHDARRGQDGAVGRADQHDRGRPAATRSSPTKDPKVFQNAVRRVRGAAGQADRRGPHRHRDQPR